jgi:hypothetical protein
MTNCILWKNGTLTIFSGYQFDGSTGATDTEETQKAAAVHDALCRMVQQGFLPMKLKFKINWEYFRHGVIASHTLHGNGLRFWWWLLRMTVRFAAISVYPWERDKPDNKVYEVP